MRKWLEQNKIIFDTLAATLLSLMAIIVSCAQTCSSNRQAELQDTQTQLAEAQAVPQFTMSLSHRLNQETGKYSDEDLVIANRGGFASEFRARAVTYLAMTIMRAGATKPIELPITGFFAASFVAPDGTGDMVTMKGINNNERMGQLDLTLRHFKEERDEMMLIDAKIIVELTYKDVRGRAHEDYFEVSSISGGRKLPQDIGRAVFERWTRATPTDFSRITSEDLVRLAREKFKSSP
jgi:hypothetical protein